MKHFLFSLAVVTVTQAAVAGVDIAVSIGQPGYYGQIELGAMPPPPVIYAAPVIIQPTPIAVMVPPVYLRVPPAHYLNWHHYCGQYHACGRPVYFVNDNWYRNTYAPHYRHPPPKHYYREPDRHHHQRYDQGPRYDR